MLRYLLLILTLFSYSFIFSQKDDTVLLIEKKAKYRIDLYVVNQSDTEQNVYLQIKGNGFRRSSFKPVRKNVKAQDTTHVTTLFKLKNIPNHYTYQLFYDANLDTLNTKITELIEKH